MPNTATFTVGGTQIIFRLLLEGAELSRAAAVTVEHIPGGNVTYVDRGGLEAPMFKCKARLDSYADLIAMQALSGASGSLVYSEDTYIATLLSCAQNKPLGRAGIRFVTLDFVITG